MSDLLLQAAAFVVALGILIVVHEFGHFWVAQRLGVKVLRFSVGFGKPLWIRRIGADRTEFVVAALPLGGFVKMLDEHEGEVASDELPRAFNRQPVWKRSAIVLAGPGFNFLFAILAYWLVFMGGTEGLRPVIGQVTAGSLAESAGLQAGEEILSIDGRQVQAWNQHRLLFFKQALAQEPVTIEVRTTSGGQAQRVIDLSRFPASDINAALVERGIGLIGFLPQPLPVIGWLDPEGPAGRAGMKTGDRVTEIDGRKVESWEDLAAGIRGAPGRLLSLRIEREGAGIRLEITPDSVAQEGETIGRIHIRPRLSELPDDMRVQVRYGALEALDQAVDNTWSMSWLTIAMLYRMLKLEVSTKNISGPITIAQYAGQSAKIGLEPFVLFLAVISISLGVLNLLPIPVLDGGHLLYYAVEAVTGRPPSERALEIGQQLGIAVLIGLMVLAFYNDITRLLQ